MAETEATEPEGPDRTPIAAFCLRVSALLYAVVALLFAVLPFAWDPAVEPEYALRAGVAWFMAAIAVGLTVLTLVAARALLRHRRWAWRTACTLFVLYVPSLFLPLGVAGLIALLGESTRARFPKGKPDRVSRFSARSPGR